jgi:hypothetical protein
MAHAAAVLDLLLLIVSSCCFATELKLKIDADRRPLGYS